MNKFVAIGLGAAAVIVALFIGAQLVGQPNVVAPPIETSSPSPAAVASEPAGPPNFADLTGGSLEPGPYLFTHVDPLRVIVTVPAGWEKNQPDWVIWSREDHKATLALSNVDDLYIDPCQPELLTRDPSVGPTVDDLVSALGTVPGWTFSAPSDVTIDGAAGQYLEFVSASPSADCPEEPLLWVANGEVLPAPIGDDELGIWIMDAGGTRLVLTTGHNPEVLDSRVAELDEIIGSMQIE